MFTNVNIVEVCISLFKKKYVNITPAHLKPTALYPCSVFVPQIVFSREPLDYVAVSSHEEALSCHYKVHIREEKVDPRKRKKASWDTVAQSSKPGELCV